MSRRQLQPRILESGRLVLATHNPGKVVELAELLAPHGIDVPPFETYADRLVAFVRAHPSLPTTGLA